VMGPIPWDWLVRAGGLPGRALHVGLLLWHLAGLQGGRVVRFSQARASEFGFSVDTARRAVRSLAGAGLVSVERVPGRALRVTIRDARPQASDDQ
jgi:hypothetical protein